MSNTSLDADGRDTQVSGLFYGSPLNSKSLGVLTASVGQPAEVIGIAILSEETQ
ncbi:MAG: hypothetical protein HC936_06230 [Leptolyngbyaceae cyanobacterium SU_3_3]|nr:hypothetical protein [Leptolyngbyaceae cyanobacterium SU_3_3]